MVECKTEAARLAHEARKLKEDKEVAEERVAALRAGGGARRDSADGSGSIGGEAQAEEVRVVYCVAFLRHVLMVCS